MHKLTEKLKDRLRLHQPQSTSITVSSIGTSGSTARKPTTAEEIIYRYRKQRGVNLGSWFVLERWITDVPFQFAHPPGQSDLDVARGANSRHTLEKHWDTWIQDYDWAWLAERGINTVRIPIGYYHLCGADPSVLTNTPFRNFEHVFTGAWARITRAIETANQHGIGVLLDLHAAPGKQNNDAHAGTSDLPMFFSSKDNRQHTIHVLRVLLSSILSLCPHPPNVVGIEVLNEPHPPSSSSHVVLKEWYASVIKELHSLDPGMPLYVGDCWRTDEYAEFIETLPATNTEEQSLVILDHHLYRCFTSSDIHIPADSHAQALSDAGAPTPQTFARVSEKIGRATRGGGLVIGEWSGALNPGSMTGNPGEQRRYVEAQLGLYEKTCAGWFFWTFRKQWEGDMGWSFRDAVRGGTFPEHVGLRIKGGQHSVAQLYGEQERGRRERVRDAERNTALAAHISYWSQHPGKYAHWRFGEGFSCGWEDAWMFLISDKPKTGGQVNELGFRGARARRSTMDFGEGYWEYEHGFVQAVDAAKRDFQAVFC